MEGEKILDKSPCVEYLNELVKELSNAIHKRIIKAYQSSDPVEAMESELRDILAEVLRRES